MQIELPQSLNPGLSFSHYSNYSGQIKAGRTLMVAAGAASESTDNCCAQNQAWVFPKYFANNIKTTDKAMC